MNEKSLSRMAKNIRTTVGRYSPEILTGIGITGMVATTVLAVKGTPKALILIEEEKRRIKHEIYEEAGPGGNGPGEIILKPVDVVKIAWKCYIPAAVMGVMSVTCLIGASSVNARRNAALMTAYTLSESALKEYSNKVVETIGEKKEKSVRDAIAKDKVDNNPVSSNKVIITGKGESLCYDAFAGRYFKSDIEKLKKAQNDVNSQLIDESYISLNDFYYAIGLENTSIGNDLGWRVDKGLISLDFSSQLSDDGTPCLVFDFGENRPQYNFDSWV